MSQADRDRALERMATDPEFARSVRANPAALAGYDLTEAERQQLLAMQTEAPAVVAVAQPRALATRRSKSSMLGMGAVGAVAAAGAASFGYIRLQPPTYARYMSIDSGARDPVASVTNGASEVVTIHARGSVGAGPVAEKRLTITKPFDSISRTVAADISSGHRIAALTVVVQRNGSDWVIYQATDVVAVSQNLGGASSSDAAATETDVFEAATLSVSYPNGP